MAIQLNPETESLIKEEVGRGLYPNMEAALDTAVQLLDEYDRKLQRLRELIAKGEIGEGVRWTPELMGQITQEADEMYRRGELPDPDVCPPGYRGIFS
jgi:Arc/MetJ-type ribon-helix-helix transcriptional regulator